MKGGWIFLVLVLGSGVGAWSLHDSPKPTVLSLRLDQHFDEVVRNSTYPVGAKGNSNLPSKEHDGSGAIWVTQPAVIIRYDDPTNGFILPPTKFASVGIEQYLVSDIETSPMLAPLPYDETVEILQLLQNQFKAAGWVPWHGNHSEWVELSKEGRKRLLRDLLTTGMSRTNTLIVPKRNLEIMLRIKCFENCETQRALFLIDVGIGKKSWYFYDGE